MKKHRWLILAASLVSPWVYCQELPPARSVAGNVVTEARAPRLRIQVPREATYLGAERWHLFDVADCEVHVFVEADARKVVKRLYWIQFEEYLPSEKQARYDYASNAIRRIGGLDFAIRARFGPTDDPVKEGSDAEHVRKLVKAAGYAMPPGMMNVRLVHLPDASHRREIMVIYAEDLRPFGVQWRDLIPGAAAADRWPSLQEGLIERAAGKIEFRQ
jgi:hypothetical protein